MTHSISKKKKSIEEPPGFFLSLKGMSERERERERSIKILIVTERELAIDYVQINVSDFLPFVET